MARPSSPLSQIWIRALEQVAERAILKAFNSILAHQVCSKGSEAPKMLQQQLLAKYQ